MNYYEAMNKKGMSLSGPINLLVESLPYYVYYYIFMVDLYLILWSLSFFANVDFLFALVTDHLEESTSVLTTDYSFYHWVAS